ncbi:MAG: ribonuclease P protein component [Burkholderiales bacterium]
MNSGAASLPRGVRLNAQGRFTGKFAHRLQGRWYQVLARPNRLNTARLGLIVGRRAAARAVDRSLAKRLAREEFRRVRGGLPGLDVVVRLTSVVARRERSAASMELRRLLIGLSA